MSSVHYSKINIYQEIALLFFLYEMFKNSTVYIYVWSAEVLKVHNFCFMQELSQLNIMDQNRYPKQIGVKEIFWSTSLILS